MLLVILLFALSIQFSVCGKSNPEEGMTVPEIITYHGYPAEEHFITTQDGYILGVHRIAGGKGASVKASDKPRPVIYLQHGLLCSSADWVVNPVNDSLAFMLADAGFDVWMGNSRGNTYSLSHQSLSVKSDEYWQFSWDEMAQHDIPATLDHIEKVTKQPQVYYVGHSQGTMVAFAGFSANQTLAKRIKTFFALAPVAYLGSMQSPIKYLAQFAPEIKWLFKILGVRDFMPQSWILEWLASHMCTLSFGESVCANVVFVICGYDPPQMNKTRLDVYMTHSPAGTSVQNMLHYAQGYQSKRFQKYDFGKEENKKKYGQSIPPEYDLSSFAVPTVLYSGGQDWLADPSDVEILERKIPKQSIIKKVNIPPWMHLDFIWGVDASRMVYKHIVDSARVMEKVD